MSAEFLNHPGHLRQDCVSDQGYQNSAEFLNDHATMHADCVLRPLQTKSRTRAAGIPRRALDSDSKPVLSELLGVALVPLRAGLAVALALAGLLGADLLPITGARRREEPLSTDLAGPLPEHDQRLSRPPSSRPSSGSPARHVVLPGTNAGWISRDEQKRINSDER